MLYDTDGTLLPPGQWDDEVLNMRKDGNIIELDCADANITGTVDLALLPATLLGLYLNANDFFGNFQVENLPRSLRHLNVRNNRFQGTIQWRSLPKDLEIAILGYNEFVGSLDLTALPTNLHVLGVCHNAFEGSVALTQLPRTLKTLTMSDSKLSGTLDFSHIPPRMYMLVIANNSQDSQILRRICVQRRYEHAGPDCNRERVSWRCCATGVSSGLDGAADQGGKRNIWVCGL